MPRKLYYFNPGHEGAILNNSPYYMLPANVVKMRQDLSYISAWYADNSEDFILLENTLPDAFKKTCNSLSLSKGITNKELALKASDAIVHLWGQSPQSIHHFEELNNRYGLNLQIPSWNENLYQLTSREMSTECLNSLIKNLPSLSYLNPPKYCTTLDEIDLLVVNSEYQLLAKAPYSSSGRGLLWLPIGELTKTEKQILHGIIKKQGKLSVEKAFNKKLDFAMEFTLSDRNISFEGYSLFETNNKGGYIGNYIGSQKSLISSITSYINIDFLEEIKSELISILSERFSYSYNGCIGVDMMIYEELGIDKLHPCVEINVRDNMGFLAISIYRKHIDPNSKGFFYLEFSQQEKDLLKKDNDLKIQYPLLIENNRIKSGYISLCPISESTKFIAYMIIEKN